MPGLSTQCYNLCVTMDSKKLLTCHCIYNPVPSSYKLLAPQLHVTAIAARIDAAKVQGFKKGDLVDRGSPKIRQSILYSLLHRLQSQGISGG